MPLIPLTRRQPTVFALFAGFFGFAVGAFAPQIFHDGDTWWHLAAGEWMLAHHAVLKGDVFSFTFTGQQWHTQEWLSEVIMACAFQLGGWSRLQMLFGVATGLTAAIVAGAVRARTAALPALLISVLGLACILGSLLARPHILALPLVALWTLGLIQAREQNRSPRAWMLAVMLLWANLHGSFAFGLGLGGAFALEAIMDDRRAIRSWSLFLAGATLAALATPHGLDGLIFPFQLLMLSSIHNIGEWRPTDLTHPGPFMIALAVLTAVTLSGRLKLPFLRALMVLGLAALALAHVRHQMLFGIVTSLIAASALRSREAETGPAPAWAAPLAALLLAGLFVTRGFMPTWRDDDAVTPLTAMAHVPDSLRREAVLNAYDFGGYMVFTGVRVFVDGRTDLYGDDFLAEYDRAMRPDVKALKETLSAWHIAWTILPPGPAARAMDAMPNWHREYSDAFAVVHIRDDYWPPG